MNIDIILFYFFSSFAFVSSIMVVTLTNSVQSVLFLILVFCNIVSLLLLLGVEFLAFLFLIIYVGAIAVLFLFVVMMLNIKFYYSLVNNTSLIITGFTVLLVFSLSIFYILDSSFIFYDFNSRNNINLTWISWFKENNSLNNIEVIGMVLYTRYSLLFLLCSLILLVSMIGVIVLTMHQRTNVKKQVINRQLLRDSTGVTKFILLRK